MQNLQRSHFQTHIDRNIRSIKNIDDLSKTRFTEHLIHENALDEHSFKEWIFHPGMLFNAQDKWWGDQGKRDKPHEGLDLCLYRDRRDRMHRLDEKTKIPVIYDGIVVGIVNDFLGKSVIIEHGLTDSDNNRFCTIYGHINPHKSLHVGRIVKEGDIIATIADPVNSKAKILSHLHISLGWASKFISYDKLDWETIDTPNTLILMDPLYVIGRHYRTLKRRSSMQELLYPNPDKPEPEMKNFVGISV